MSALKAREIPISLFTISVIVLILGYFTTVRPFIVAADYLKSFGVLLALIAVFLGVADALRIHLRHIAERTPRQWYLSVWLIVTMLMMFVFGYVQKSTYDMLYANFYIPLSVGIAASIGYYLYSAFFRAFRVRNSEAAVLFTCAIIVVLKNAPIGEAIWTGFSVAGAWITDVPVAGSARAILMGAALGMIALAIRSMLGKEQGYLGGE
jgi:hypothetical protein